MKKCRPSPLILFCKIEKISFAFLILALNHWVMGAPQIKTATQHSCVIEYIKDINTGRLIKKEHYGYSKLNNFKPNLTDRLETINAITGERKVLEFIYNSNEHIEYVNTYINDEMVSEIYYKIDNLPNGQRRHTSYTTVSNEVVTIDRNYYDSNELPIQTWTYTDEKVTRISSNVYEGTNLIKEYSYIPRNKYSYFSYGYEFVDLNDPALIEQLRAHYDQLNTPMPNLKTIFNQKKSIKMEPTYMDAYLYNKRGQLEYKEFTLLASNKTIRLQDNIYDDGVLSISSNYFTYIAQPEQIFVSEIVYFYQEDGKTIDYTIENTTSHGSIRTEYTFDSHGNETKKIKSKIIDGVERTVEKVYTAYTYHESS